MRVPTRLDEHSFNRWRRDLCRDLGRLCDCSRCLYNRAVASADALDVGLLDLDDPALECAVVAAEQVYAEQFERHRRAVVLAIALELRSR